MITLTRRYKMESAHQLTGMPEGHKCSRMHGHNYKIELTMRQVGALDNGMLIDGGNLDIEVLPVLRRYDHTVLNESLRDGTPTGELAATQPTAEHIALHLWARLGFLRNGAKFATLVRVRVYENDDLWADADGETP